MIKLSRYILFAFLLLITAWYSVSAHGLSLPVICNNTLAEYGDDTSILKGNQMYKNKDPSNSPSR